MRKRIDEGKKAIQETSVINEGFALKNETFGATLDKLGKEFNKLVSSPGITNFLKGAVEGALAFIKAIRNIPSFIQENKIALLTLLAGILLLKGAYVSSALATIKDTAAKVLNAVVTKLSAAATYISITAQSAYIVVTNLLAGRITFLTAVQRIWNVVMGASKTAALGVIGIAIGLISILGNLIFSTKKLSAEQEANNKLQERSLDAYSDQINKIELLKKVITSETSSLAEKKQAQADLIAINPDFQKTLVLDAQGHLQGAAAIDEYIKKLKSKGTLEAALALSGETQKEILKKEGLLEAVEKSKVPEQYKEIFRNKTLAEIKDLKAAKDIYDKKHEELFKVDVAANTPAAGANLPTQAAANNVGALRASLQKQIDGLKATYEDINIQDKKAQANNIANRKKLQAELDALDGKDPKADPKQKKSANDLKQLKKDADEFVKEIKALKSKQQFKGEDPEQGEIDAAKDKYLKLKARATEFFVEKLKDKKRFNESEKIIDEAQAQELENIFQHYLKKRQELEEAKKYDDHILFSEEAYNNEKVKIARAYAENKIGKEQYEKEIKLSEAQEATARIAIAENYSECVKKAATDVVKFKKDKEKLTTQNEIEEAEKRKKLTADEALDKARRAVLTSRPGTEARLKAEKEELQLKFDQEMAFKDKTSEEYLRKEAELQLALKELDQNATLDKIAEIEKYAGYFQQALNFLNQFITNRENKLFAREKADNDKKKKGYKEQLDKKLISKEQYDKSVQKLDDTEEKHKKELARKQAQREKALTIFSTILSTTAAVAGALAAKPVGPWNIVQAAIFGALGGLQIAAAASAPLPELGKGKWVKDGDKHSDASGGIHAMIERDEAVMSAAAMTDPNSYTATGTVAQITSALNSKNGGVNWAGGAVVNMSKWLTERPASINPNMPRIMEQGGIVRPINQVAAGSDNETKDLLRKNNQLLEQHIQVTKEKADVLRAVVSIKEFKETNASYEAARKVAGVNQK